MGAPFFSLNTFHDFIEYGFQLQIDLSINIRAVQCNQDEIPKNLVTKLDCSNWNPVQQRAFFADWLKTKMESTVMLFEPSSAKITPIKPEMPALRSSKSEVGRDKKSSSSEYKPATKAALPKATGFRKNQLVHHEKYGSGLVQDVSEHGDGTKYVTVKYKSSTKKILSDFLK